MKLVDHYDCAVFVYSSQSQIEIYLKSIKETAAAAAVVRTGTLEPPKKKRTARKITNSTNQLATSTKYGEFTTSVFGENRPQFSQYFAISICNTLKNQGFIPKTSAFGIYEALL